MSEHFDTVVLGGGLSGLVAGLLAQRKYPNGRTLVIEASGRLGGVMAGSRAVGECFDLGTHIPQETGIGVVDELFERALDQNSLQRMSSEVGDRAGTLVDQRLFVDTSYFDLLCINSEIAKRVLAHVVGKPDTDRPDPHTPIRLRPAEEVARDWFGDEATNTMILPILRNWFGDTSLLSGFALELVNLTRLRVVDELTWLSHASSSSFRQRVAFPHQLRLPAEFKHNRKSIYPKCGSSISFVEGFERLCAEREVELSIKSRVRWIDLASRRLKLERRDEKLEIGFHRLISTLGPLHTLPLVVEGVSPMIERCVSKIIHHIAERPTKSELCYIYAYSERSPVFRVTNYQAFSGRTGDCRFTSELLAPETISDEFAIAEAERALQSSGFVELGGRVQSFTEPLAGGFPSPKISTFEQFQMATAQLALLESDDFIVTGIGAQGTAFFQSEILRHLSSRLT